MEVEDRITWTRKLVVHILTQSVVAAVMQPHYRRVAREVENFGLERCNVGTREEVVDTGLGVVFCGYFVVQVAG